jgi:hypothetical protein
VKDFTEKTRSEGEAKFYPLSKGRIGAILRGIGLNNQKLWGPAIFFTNLPALNCATAIP